MLATNVKVTRQEFMASINFFAQSTAPMRLWSPYYRACQASIPRCSRRVRAFGSLRPSGTPDATAELGRASQEACEVQRRALLCTALAGLLGGLAANGAQAAGDVLVMPPEVCPSLTYQLSVQALQCQMHTAISARRYRLVHEQYDHGEVCLSKSHVCLLTV